MQHFFFFKSLCAIGALAFVSLAQAGFEYHIPLKGLALSAPLAPVEPAAPAVAPSPLGDGISKMGACAAGAATGCATWDPLAGGGQYVLGADLLTMTGKYALNWQHRSIRATVGKSTGRWYWEISVVTPGSNSNSEYLGIANTQSNFADPAFTGSIGTALGTAANTFRAGSPYTNTGLWATPNTTVATWGVTTVGYALDADSGKLFMCQAGVWLGGANPETGIGPRLMGFPGQAIYPAAAIWNTSTIKANFGSENFVACAPPTGYHAGIW